jgi:hypothetical protein
VVPIYSGTPHAPTFAWVAADIIRRISPAQQPGLTAALTHHGPVVTKFAARLAGEFRFNERR